MSRIDLSQPPYQVPCPACGAFAMQACQAGGPNGLVRARSGLNVPTSNIIDPPHDQRWMQWGLHPEMRVKVTQDTWVRWQETFQEWMRRMIIHCPTARTVGELMFFAAEKLNMTTRQYMLQYFPEFDTNASQLTTIYMRELPP